MVLFEIGIMAVGAVGVAYAYVEIADGLKQRRQNKAIAAADPADPIDESDSYAAVEGTVGAAETVPVGERGSVAVQADVWQYGLSDDNEYLDLEETSAVPFYIDTGEMKVPVDPAGIDVVAPARGAGSETVESGERPSDVVRQYAEYRDFDPLPTGGKRDYDIEWIEPGDEVVVFGGPSRREGVTAIADGDGAFFVTDSDPAALRETHQHVFKKAVVKAAIPGIAGVAVILVGLLALFV